MRISNKILHNRSLGGYQLEKITTSRCNVPSSNYHLQLLYHNRGHKCGTGNRALSPSFYSCLIEMQQSRDDAEEPLEMPCVPDVVRGSSISTVRNCLRYIHLYMTSEVHVHEKGSSIWTSHLCAACNGDILSKRELTAVLEDRTGTTKIELRESTCLKRFQ